MNNEKTAADTKSEYFAQSIEIAESIGASTTNPNGGQKHELKRGLKARHIQMIALGGTIGKFFFKKMISFTTIKSYDINFIHYYYIRSQLEWTLCHSMVSTSPL